MTLRATVGLVVACAFAGFHLDAQSPEPIDFKAFAEGRYWIVRQPITYVVGVSKESVTVPVGFVVELASIPPTLQSIIQQNGRYLLPAVVHDFLYWKQTCNRAQSDGILRLAMIEQNAAYLQWTAIYDVVRIAGSFTWDLNAMERKAGLPRIIPATHLQIPPAASWADYREDLFEAKVAEGPDGTMTPGFCARGDMPVDTALKTP
jgi:uncharacterized protein DUF1353